MPLVQLVAEGIGPFERLEIDFSDGQGNPHLGPHILAGVNGSGKSTVLRTIAWVLDLGTKGFDYIEWSHFLSGRGRSRAAVELQEPGSFNYARACATSGGRGASVLPSWAIAQAKSWGFLNPSDTAEDFEIQNLRLAKNHPRRIVRRPDVVALRIDQQGPLDLPDAGSRYNIAGYSPSKVLKHMASPSLTARLVDQRLDALAFDSTIQNEAIQAWLLGLYSKRAIANERHQPVQQYTRSLERFENALKLMYGGDIEFEVDIEPNFQPRLKLNGHSLNFSQLPDGVRGTVGWVADFMMRQDSMKWDPKLQGSRPGILLLDEVDAHLHPLWQRRLLPAMREALPDVQIIVTSHSPFVISSCPGSRVHVLEVDQHGKATNRPPVDSPIGESVLTTLKEIFGINSRFDIRTEGELNEWNALKRKEVAGKLNRKNKTRLLELTLELAGRSDELRSLVAGPSGSFQSFLYHSVAEVGVLPVKGLC